MRPFRLKNFSLVSEIKQNWIRFTCVSLFHYKFHFSSLIFASNFSLRFTLVIFASKWNKAIRNSSPFFLFSFFSLFFAFFRFFRLIFVLLRFFRLIFAYFTFVFASYFWCLHRSESCEIRLFFACKRNEIFASISNFASEAKVRAHPTSMYLCTEKGIKLY